MHVDHTLFLTNPSNAEALSLKQLTSDAEIASATLLLCKCLMQVNQNAGKTLYRQTEEGTKAFLSEISELYGVYDTTCDLLIAMIAIEEDSIERIAVLNAYQRRGIGHALMVFAQEKLSAGYVDVYADNIQALRFFDSCGLSMFDETAPEPGDLMALDSHKIIHLMY